MKKVVVLTLALFSLVGAVFAEGVSAGVISGTEKGTVLKGKAVAKRFITKKKIIKGTVALHNIMISVTTWHEGLPITPQSITIKKRHVSPEKITWEQVSKWEKGPTSDETEFVWTDLPPGSYQIIGVYNSSHLTAIREIYNCQPDSVHSMEFKFGAKSK